LMMKRKKSLTICMHRAEQLLWVMTNWIVWLHKLTQKDTKHYFCKQS